MCESILNDVIMARRKKLIVWTGILILILVVCYMVLPQVIGTIISAGPRNPRLEIEETYKIGWWSNQEALTVESFEVEFVESKLNLFNNKSLIKYTVKGKMKKDGHWRPSIKSVHISQRFLRRHNAELYFLSDTVKTPEGMIEITPIIEVEKDKNYNGEEIEFEFTNEIKLESFHWGANRVRFQCDDKWQDLILSQTK